MGAYLVKRAAGEVLVFFAFGVFALFWINNIYSSKDWDWPPAHRNATSNLTSEGDQSQLVNGDDYQSWILQDAKEREGVLEAGQDASASRRHEDTGSGPELLEAVQTRPHQAGRPYPGVLRQPSKDYHSPEPGEEKSEAELLAIRRTICERIFSYHLHIVDDFQYGPTTRVFIWIPMLLQAAKLLVVRGAWFARLVGFVYLLSWLTIEVLSILCAGHSLTAEEQKKAFELAQSLHAPNWIVAHQADDVARYPLYENPASICAELLLIFHGAHNWMSLARILGSYDGAGIYFSFIVFVPLVVPIPLILLGSLAVSLWRLTGLEASELGKTNAQMDTERGKILQQAPLLDDCGRRRALDDTITSKGSGIGRQHSKHLILGLQHGRILDQCDTGKSDAAWDVTMDIEIAD
ncbi:MAG: hypothetical protein L6R39_004664 [Caloplaca ligustica]|nr:MAG: hypothetical protein L6R39_004664 [Caloplaca ligustica]